jgi:hypothetical protein
MLATGNVNCIALPPLRPNLNAFAERWVRSVKQECLSRLILFGEGFGASDSLLGLHQETEAAFDREGSSTGWVATGATRADVV